MKPLPHPYRPIPGEAEYCQKSGHTGHYRRTAQKSGPQATYARPTRTETMRSEDDKGETAIVPKWRRAGEWPWGYSKAMGPRTAPGEP